MKVDKWGEELAIRIPDAVVEALSLKEGDDLEIGVAGEPSFELGKSPTPKERMIMLRRFRGSLPEDFRFDRDEANKRR